MMRLLLEDVTLLYEEAITLHLRCRGGATKTVTLPKPLLSWETWTTPATIVAEIDRLLNDHTYGEIADILNERQLRPGVANDSMLGSLPAFRPATPCVLATTVCGKPACSRSTKWRACSLFIPKP
jgi:hypothetical protein